MSSDAKIGLLLGLVFIFIIAFIINGLPSLRHQANNDELTNNMLSLKETRPGLAAEARKAHYKVIAPVEPVRKEPARLQVPQAVSEEIRFDAELPKSPAAVQEGEEVKSVTSVQALPSAKKEETVKVKSLKPSLPNVYVVKDGDSLAGISQSVYGSEAGNKLVNVERIFQANRKLLKSPDEIYAGQELVIPPLSASASGKSEKAGVLDNPVLEKVKSIGKRHQLTGNQGAKQGRWHLVREGDSLWRIAAEKLGDGKRYKEIAKLNAGVLDGEDNLVVGMRLKISAR